MTRHFSGVKSVIVLTVALLQPGRAIADEPTVYANLTTGFRSLHSLYVATYLSQLAELDYQRAYDELAREKVFLSKAILLTVSREPLPLPLHGNNLFILGKISHRHGDYMGAYRAFGGAFKIFHDANGIHDDNCVIALMCVGISEGNLGRYDDAEGTLEVALKLMREKRWEGRDEFRMAQKELDTIRARRPVEDAGGGTRRLAEGN